MQASGDGPTTGMRPTLVISLDFELAWGSFDHGLRPEVLEMARWTHDEGAPALLEALVRNGLPATWATVGLLLHDRLPDVGDLVPVALPDGRDWFAHVPRGATECSAPEWFAAAFVRKLLDAKPRQEIGFHGYSHVILDDPGVPRARVQQELARCAQLAKTFGLGPPSFVFPRSQVAHLDALRAAGFACYRGKDELPLGLQRREPTRRGWMLLADLLGLPSKMVQPQVVDGLVNVPGSLMVRYAGGWRRHIPDALRLRRLRSGLSAVCRDGGVFHVWLHPENLFFERPRLERVLAEFFAEAGELASASKLRVLTMGDVAREGPARDVALRPAGS